MGKIKVVANTIHSAKVFIYRIEKKRPSFLVIKEPEGIYGFPGGAQEVSDVTILDTARRELVEETGLTEKSCTIKETNLTHEFVHTDPKSERFGKKGILHAFLAEYNGYEPVKLDSELLQVAWLREKDVLQTIKTSYPYLTPVFKKIVNML